MSTLVKTDALGGDPTFAPVRKLAPELLSEIFLLCIVERFEREDPGDPPQPGYGMDLQATRGQLARVCRWWNTVLNNDPRAWATIALNDEEPPITPETVMLWIKRSKSHLLNVYIGFEDWPGSNWDDGCSIVAVLLTQLWRIRCLVWMIRCHPHTHLSTLLPHSASTYAPMLQSLSFIGHGSSNLSNIHCPDLRTLTIKCCDQAIKSLIGKPMPTVRHLFLTSNGQLHIEILEVLPNLVSLKWMQLDEEPVEVPQGRVALQSLKSLTLAGLSPQILTCFYAPSLESLNLAGAAAELIDVLKIIRHDWNVTLRHLTITGELPEETAIHAMLPYLTHLETFIVRPQLHNSIDELLMALSPVNRDFTLACPRLQTMEIDHGRVSTNVLVDFVGRRVKPDSVDLVPGLMTSLKLSFIHVDQDVCEQLVKSHGSSVHMRFNSQTFIHLCNYVIDML